MPSRVTFLGILWEELREPMILLLLTVGVLYSIFGEPGDAVTIFSVIVVLALAEVQNEYRAKRAVDRLAEMASPKATVVRDGGVTHVDASELVTGDLLVLSAGTKLAADAGVLEALGLQVDESPITGESFPAEKPAGSDVFAGTVVVGGSGLAQISATGKATKLGELAEGLKSVKPPKTPLQRAMKELSGKLVWVAVVFSVAIPVLGVLRGQPLRDMVLIGLSLSFATIPEEMPIIITMVLGLGSYRLSKQNFLVKRLSAAETMGAVNVIATDKTGTLTASRMELTATFSAMDERAAVEQALGAVSLTDETFIDVALKNRAGELGIALDARKIVRRRDLGDGAKTRSVLRADGTLYVTGAPEQVFEHCREVPESVREAFDGGAVKGWRLVAVATRRISEKDLDASWDLLERELESVALLAFSDPPRPEVPEAIAAMAAAGVRTIMVTGDHPATALAIAREVGIASGADGVETGEALDAMTDDELARSVAGTNVFARTTPQHKYRIVSALQALGLHVAVTGDGVNDSLAIKGADIGIAMGIRGTDVAKEAADVILADDDYATIAKAVFEGRVFFDNLRKGVKYYLSVKAALIAVFLLPALFGLPMPFPPVQIILLELFMDLAASAGFVAEPAEPDIHTRRPEAMTTRILDKSQTTDLLLKGFFLFAPVMAAYAYAGLQGMTVAEKTSLSFVTWMIGHVVLAFVSRSDRQPLLRVGIASNRVVDAWALATAVFLGVGLYVPQVASRLRLVPLPVGLVFSVAIALVGWMSLLEVRKYLRAQVR
jgi:Ca2+-transporting ATPase